MISVPVRPRILVVEDDRAIRSLLSVALRHEGLDVDVAADGAEALALTQQTSYAVVILDLLMPRMNGFEFVEAFRLGTPDAKTLLIVVSAFDDAMLHKLSACQVHALVRKPFDVMWLSSLVHDVAMTWSARMNDASITRPATRKEPLREEPGARAEPRPAV